jgi:hypothetical protein
MDHGKVLKIPINSRGSFALFLRLCIACMKIALLESRSRVTAELRESEAIAKGI